MKPANETLRLENIRWTSENQARAGMDRNTLDEYTEAMKEDAAARTLDRWPPLEVVRDTLTGEEWGWDGHHRSASALAAGIKFFPCLVTVADNARDYARWLSASANATHGLRRTNDDKRKAVTMALEIHPEMSDRAIAKHCGVSDKTVAAVRDRCGISAPETRVGQDGKTYTVPAKAVEYISYVSDHGHFRAVNQIREITSGVAKGMFDRYTKATDAEEGVPWHSSGNCRSETKEAAQKLLDEMAQEQGWEVYDPRESTGERGPEGNPGPGAGSGTDPASGKYLAGVERAGYEAGCSGIGKNPHFPETAAANAWQKGHAGATNKTYIPPMVKPVSAPETEPTEEERQNAYERGKRDFSSGRIFVGGNPLPGNDPLAEHWNDGYQAAAKEVEQPEDTEPEICGESSPPVNSPVEMKQFRDGSTVYAIREAKSGHKAGQFCLYRNHGGECSTWQMVTEASGGFDCSMMSIAYSKLKRIAAEKGWQEAYQEADQPPPRPDGISHEAGRVKDAYEEGSAAASNGANRFDCPYKKGTPEHAGWTGGWDNSYKAPPIFAQPDKAKTATKAPPKTTPAPSGQVKCDCGHMASTHDADGRCHAMFCQCDHFEPHRDNGAETARPAVLPPFGSTLAQFDNLPRLPQSVSQLTEATYLDICFTLQALVEQVFHTPEALRWVKTEEQWHRVYRTASDFGRSLSCAGDVVQDIKQQVN